MAFKHRLFAGIAISLFAGAVYAQPPQWKYAPTPTPATATYPGNVLLGGKYQFEPNNTASPSQGLIYDLDNLWQPDASITPSNFNHYSGLNITTSMLNGSVLQRWDNQMNVDTVVINTTGPTGTPSTPTGMADGHSIAHFSVEEIPAGLCDGMGGSGFSGPGGSPGNNCYQEVGGYDNTIYVLSPGHYGEGGGSAQYDNLNGAGAVPTQQTGWLVAFFKDYPANTYTWWGYNVNSAGTQQTTNAPDAGYHLQGGWQAGLDLSQGNFNNCDILLGHGGKLCTNSGTNLVELQSIGGMVINVASGGTGELEVNGSISAQWSNGGFNVPGAFVVGSPTGGAEGAGSINAQSIFINGVAVGTGGGGGVTSISATAPLTGGTITTSGSIGLPTTLGGAASYTAHGLLVGEGASALALVGPNATAGAFLLGAGSSADPAYSTAATLTSSGLAMSGATGGQEGAGSINAQSFYQNGSQVNVLNFLTACPSCSFTLPGVNDTLIGLASTPVLANLWTFNANIQLSDGGNITGTSNPADEFLKINGNITAGQGYLAALVAGANGHGSSSGYALLSLGGNSLGGITNASGVVGGATYDQQIFASGTAGYYGYRVNPTVSSAGSGIEDAYDIYHGSTRWSAWDYRGLFAPHVFTVSTLPTTGPVPDTGARATISDQLTTCAAIGVAPTGGGSVVCPVMWNGSAWISG